MPEPAVAIPDEDPQKTISRLREENQDLRALLDTYQRVYSGLDKKSLEVLLLQKTVANQRLQLRNQSDSFWRRKEATRRLREKLGVLIGKLAETDQDFLDDFHGKNGAEARRALFLRYGA